MNGKRFRLWPAQMFLVLPAVALLGWGILGGGLRPGTPVAVAPNDPTGSAPAMVAASETRAADSGHWCDEGLGCNDGGLRPGTSVAVAPNDPTGSAPAMVAASETRAADSGHWCDVGLGCNDGQ